MSFEVVCNEGGHVFTEIVDDEELANDLSQPLSMLKLEEVTLFFGNFLKDVGLCFSLESPICLVELFSYLLLAMLVIM